MRILTKRKDYIINYVKLSTTKDRRKFHKLRRNHLIGKDDSSNCNHKSKNLNIKDYEDVNQITKIGIQSNALIAKNADTTTLDVLK